MGNEEKEALAAKSAAEKEELRLAKEPFKTMIEPLDKSTTDDLRGWKQPRHAYALFESRHWDVKKEAWYRSTFTFNVDGRPDQLSKIAYYLRKGFRVLHYGNFPSSNSADPRIQARIGLYRGGPDQANPWDVLKAELDREMNKKDSSVLERERDDFQAKYERMKAENESLKNKGKANAKD